MTPPGDLIWRTGGCHCKAVRFEAALAPNMTVQTCNCSICAMVGFIHAIVPERHFRLLQGENQISTYVFNTGVARHTFCKVCGVKSFYRPRSNPDGWSVNVRCLDPVDGMDFEIEPFDGQNWEAHAAGLAHLSKESP